MSQDKINTMIARLESLYSAVCMAPTFKSKESYKQFQEDYRRATDGTGRFKSEEVTSARADVFKHITESFNVTQDVVFNSLRGYEPQTTYGKEIRKKTGSVLIGDKSQALVLESFSQIVNDFAVDMGWTAVFTTRPATGQTQAYVWDFATEISAYEKVDNGPIKFSNIGQKTAKSILPQIWECAVQMDRYFMENSTWIDANEIMSFMRLKLDELKASTAYTKLESASGTEEAFDTNIVKTVNNAVVSARTALKAEGFMLTDQTQFILVANTSHKAIIEASMNTIPGTDGNNVTSIWNVSRIYSEYPTKTNATPKPIAWLVLPGKKLMYVPFEAQRTYSELDWKSDTIQQIAREMWTFNHTEAQQVRKVVLTA